MFPKNSGQPGHLEYDFSAQLLILSEIYINFTFLYFIVLYFLYSTLHHKVEIVSKLGLGWVELGLRSGRGHVEFGSRSVENRSRLGHGRWG